MTGRSTTAPDAHSARPERCSFELTLDGWLVWDGLYTPLRVGDEFTASVEFVPLSPAAENEGGTRFQHVDGNHYAVVAKVLRDVDSVVALDLGDLTVLRRQHPDQEFVLGKEGSTVSLKIGLNLNPWAEEPWSRRAVAEYSADRNWRVERIRLVDADRPGSSLDIDEASMETVESSGQYCLLTCTLLPNS